MPTQHPLLQKLYEFFLRLYPRRFRDEFSFEMQADFADALRATAGHGLPALITLCIREGRDVLRGALAEQWKGDPMALDSATRVGRVGITFAVLPFVIVMLLAAPAALILYLPQWFGYAILAFLGLALLVGLARGLPAWSLPYVGFCLGIVGLFTANLMHPILLPLYRVSQAEWWPTALDEGVMWWGTLVTVPVLLILSALLSPLQPFYNRVRGDWSLLSFALYGNIPIALAISFDEYVGENLFVIAAAVTLILGAYQFLRRPTQGQRVMALATAITLCVGIIILAKWLLLPSQRWGDELVPPTPDTFFKELIRTIAMWGWMMSMILGLPALLDRILARIPSARLHHA